MKAKKKSPPPSDTPEPPPHRARVLVVEDEQDLQELLRYNLIRDGFAVDTATSGEQALACTQRIKPDLILLDLMLPGMDGLDVCRLCKADPSTASIPIVMLTAKGEESDIVTGLELGADDYIAKPFSPRVVVARLKAVLRRQQAPVVPDDSDPTVRVGPLAIDPTRHEVSVGTQPVELTHTEFRVLFELAKRPGRVLTRSQIVQYAQGDHVIVTDRSVDVHVASLRRKLLQDSHLLQTVRGVGYRIKEAP